MRKQDILKTSVEHNQITRHDRDLFVACHKFHDDSSCFAIRETRQQGKAHRKRRHRWVRIIW